MNGETKPVVQLSTKLCKIAERSSRDTKAVFSHLMPIFTVENLACCFDQLDGKKAVGIDGKSKQEYAEKLDQNLWSLVKRMKRMAYRPQPVREILIPKGKGKMRPLGISVIEDKIVQSLFAKVLESIYEPLFRECSFGFRPNRSAHDAVRLVINSSFSEGISEVIDVDLENFFGSIDHDKLLALLSLKIKDETFLRYVLRMCKAGISSDGKRIPAKTGTPQGSLVSPILANIVGHYAFDIWFEEVVLPRCRGNARLVRYCDDIVILCEDRRDSVAIKKALVGRCDRFSLKLNAEKSTAVAFSRTEYAKGVKQGAFDFLGFTFYIGRSRRGLAIPKLKTRGKSFRDKLRNVNLWCKRCRDSARMPALWKVFCVKLQGHISYYGVSHNIHRVVDFIHKARRAFFRWMNRRSQRRSLNWEQFLLFEKRFPPPCAQVVVRLF